MGSDWVGVAGTAIGAGIGGVVTVISLAVKGHQDARARRDAAQREDRHRSEDRTWSVRVQDVRERRDAYRGMLDAGREVVLALTLLHSRFASDPTLVPGLSDAVEHERQRVLAAMQGFVSASAVVDVLAVDEAVLTLSRELSQSAGHALAAIAFQTTDAEDSLGDVQRLSRELTAACRADLGYASSGLERET